MHCIVSIEHYTFEMPLASPGRPRSSPTARYRTCRRRVRTESHSCEPRRPWIRRWVALEEEFLTVYQQRGVEIATRAGGARQYLAGRHGGAWCRHCGTYSTYGMAVLYKLVKSTKHEKLADVCSMMLCCCCCCCCCGEATFLKNK